MGIYKKYCLKFQSIQDMFFFYFFCLVYIKWLIYKPLNISIGAIMKNPEMLKFVPDHLKSKKKL